MSGRFAVGGCWPGSSRSGPARSFPVRCSAIASRFGPVVQGSSRIGPVASCQPSRCFGGSGVPSWSGLVFIRLPAPRLASTHVSLAVTCSSLRGVAPSSRFAGTHVWPVPVSVAGWWRSGRTFRLGSHSFPVRFAGTRVAVRCRPVGVTVGWQAARGHVSSHIRLAGGGLILGAAIRGFWLLLFGSHIRWWSHLGWSRFGGGQGSFSAGGQGLRVAGG